MSFTFLVLLCFLLPRHVIFILLGVLILLDGVLLMLAAVLGQVGASLYDTPAYRSNVADWGGRLMIG